MCGRARADRSAETRGDESDEVSGAVRRWGARSTDCRAKRAGADRSAAESGDRELGQVTPLIALAILLVGGIALVIGHIGGMLVAHAQARAAADAAALAGALDGPAAAAEAAVANGARLLEVRVDETDTEVKVQVGDAIALARARRGLSRVAAATAFSSSGEKANAP
jgi:Putative Flp pilus-assembly TadE/G-like